ncbi:MAG: hypothetical protein JWM87_1191 [Candidatus Eremiobacteraeota bacterium]|nr:hypothetical protein [Candidatus Eremiobacteraeota bacterium]
MQQRHVLRAAALAAVFAASAVAPANADPMRTACSMLPLASVGTLVGRSVTVFHDGAPVTTSGLEATNCLYMSSMKGEIAASVWLGRGTHARMLSVNQAFATSKRHQGVNGMRGDTVVLVNVTSPSGSGVAYHDDISKKLLAAVLSKV